MVIHTDGDLTVSNWRGSRVQDATAEDPFHEEFRIEYKLGGHSMPMTEERAAAYVEANPQHEVASRVVTEWAPRTPQSTCNVANPIEKENQ